MVCGVNRKYNFFDIAAIGADKFANAGLRAGCRRDRRGRRILMRAGEVRAAGVALALCIGRRVLVEDVQLRAVGRCQPNGIFQRRICIRIGKVCRFNQRAFGVRAANAVVVGGEGAG